MKNKWICLLACILLCMMSYANVTANQSNNLKRTLILDDSERLNHVLLKSDDAQEIASAFIRQGFDVLDNTITDDAFELIISPDELKELQTQGFHIEILTQGRPFCEIQAEQMQSMAPLVPAGYLDYPEIINELYNYENQYPAICKVYDLTTWYNISATYEGRHLYALKISDNVNQDEDEPNFLMVGAHHAREIVTPVLCNYSIMKFTTQYGTDPAVTTAVNSYEIWIAPVWNPDGYTYMYNFNNMWRKNRFPPDGVDLNRNYPFGWYSSGSGSTDPYSETYKGASPASEAETQTMLVFSNDRYFAKVLDYHSSGREVLYGYLSLVHPFTSFLQSEAVRLSYAVGYGGANRLASADGEHYQWQLAYNGSYSNLIETHTTFQPTYASALSEAVLVWPGTLWLLQRPITISGHVKDSYNGAPLVATITLKGITFPNGEHYMSEPRFGRYHLFLPPGTYTVNFSVEGYHPQEHQMTVDLSSAEILDVALHRFNEPPSTPTITGETKCFVGGIYDYVFSSYDPNDNTIEYFVDWGDGTNTSWIGPFESGQEVNVSHQWYRTGDYQIKVKAKDVYHEESNWSAPLAVQVISLKRSYIFGSITEKNQTEEFVSVKAKNLLVIISSTVNLYRSGETILISKGYKLGFIGNRFVVGIFTTAIFSDSPSLVHPLSHRLRLLRHS
ncbi:hypothetical protein AYK25_01400 [Thermoplasmatales archaeon SM1-50]|nr:MAG: hypothetical protein AYK25_01400 [Thermoplasmatales archaeon SM1-50]